MWKQGFNAWEQATSQYMEKVMSNPGVLGSAGAMLTALMKTKSATDKVMSAWWSTIGLPTRRDQERSLHKLNQLESRLYDLEEQLAVERSRNAHPGAPQSPHVVTTKV
ncbi:MAG: poly(R)-hydroxyalkanoic acid synthase subunit PhaE [Kofleriaceae bacterium]